MDPKPRRRCQFATARSNELRLRYIKENSLRQTFKYLQGVEPMSDFPGGLSFPVCMFLNFDISLNFKNLSGIQGWLADVSPKLASAKSCSVSLSWRTKPSSMADDLNVWRREVDGGSIETVDVIGAATSIDCSQFLIPPSSFGKSPSEQNYWSASI